MMMRDGGRREREGKREEWMREGDTEGRRFEEREKCTERDVKEGARTEVGVAVTIT